MLGLQLCKPFCSVANILYFSVKFSVSTEFVLVVRFEKASRWNVLWQCFRVWVCSNNHPKTSSLAQQSVLHVIARQW